MLAAMNLFSAAQSLGAVAVFETLLGVLSHKPISAIEVIVLDFDLQKATALLGPFGIAVHPVGSHFKMFMKSNPLVEGKTWSSPYVTIFPASEVENVVEFETPDASYAYPARMLYPFRRVPFENTRVKIPYASEEMLDELYPLWQAQKAPEPSPALVKAPKPRETLKKVKKKR